MCTMNRPLLGNHHLILGGNDFYRGQKRRSSPPRSELAACGPRCLRWALADYWYVNMLGMWCRFVNIGAGTRPGALIRRGEID